MRSAASGPRGDEGRSLEIFGGWEKGFADGGTRLDGRDREAAIRPVIDAGRTGTFVELSPVP